MATNTFLFTDIAGSTRLWEANPHAMEGVLRSHDQLTFGTIERHGGRVFKHTGDGVAAVFDSARPALEAARQLQTRLAADVHPEVGPLRVRIGIHSGEAQERDGDHFGLSVTRAARLMSAGHGGQVLVSEVTERLAGADDLPLLDLGEHRLKDLSRAERIYQLAYDGAPEGFPPLRTLNIAPNNLPIVPTSFVGRDQEQAELEELVRGSRLVTITGVGGAGKTRVALHTAADLAAEFLGGVWLVELAAVTDPTAVDSAVMAVLGVEQPSKVDARHALIQHLGQVEGMLLIIDNCEHLIDAVAETVGEVLTHCLEVTLIATSRELLGVPGEVSYRLRSMALPRKGADPEAVRSADAVRLFVERGAAARPGFRLTQENAVHIVEICRRLDGMPLALELAAARLRSFSADQIASHLDQRFRLLTGGNRTALPRQQTLTATIEWSYRLLDETEAELLRRLSVFQDGFTFEAVTAVCTGEPIDELDVLELLPGLVDKSLVVADDDRAGTRYRLLETLRQFARDRLDEIGHSEQWRRRHAEYFAALAEVTGVERMYGQGGEELIGRLRPEVGNVRQAMAWAIGTGEFDTALNALRAYKRISARVGAGWSEGLSWTSQVFEAAPDQMSETQRALLLYLHGTSLALAGDLDASIALLSESVEIQRRLDSATGDPDLTPEFPMTLNWLSLATMWNGGGGERNEHYCAIQHEILARARQRNESFMVAATLANLAHHQDPGGDPTEARELFEEAERAARDIGADGIIAGLGWQRAGFEFHQGELEEAHRLLVAAERKNEELGSEDDALTARVLRLHIAVELGGLDQVEEYRRVLSAWFDDERRASVRDHQIALAMGAGIDAALGRPQRLAIAAGASAAMAERGHALRWDYGDYFQRITDGARSELDEGTFRRRFDEGAEMSSDAIARFLLDV